MYEVVVDLLRPYLLLWVLVLLAVANLWRKRAESRGRLLLLTVPVVALALWSSPLVGHLVVGSLEWQYPPQPERPEDAQAIVVLAAGVRPPNSVRLRAEMDEDTLLRCLHAADLYHQGPACPVLVSGGTVDPETDGPSCARLMADFLQQLGVREEDLIMEEGSRTTFENAVESRKLLDKRGLVRVVLVADAVDMFRAVRCFRKEGVEVVPSGCHYRVGEFSFSPLSLAASPSAVRGSERAWHEWLGTVWYWLQGRI